MTLKPTYDAILIVSFGGPEGPDDVIPFLENVLRGKHVPRERMLEVAEHYREFGGVSPINQQNRDLMAALEAELEQNGLDLPVYWGNRNWHPLLPDTLREMKSDGVQRALAFFTSAYSSYSGCRQYRENIIDAQAEVGSGVPEVDKIRAFYNHPGFIEPMGDHTRSELSEIPAERRTNAVILFTAHSIPDTMAANCDYEAQLLETCRLVADNVGHSNWQLAYQSRSGPPSQPWLEPDVCDVLEELHDSGVRDVVISPIGFVSCHMEVIYDLDHEAREKCLELGLNMRRAATVGVHPRFVSMIRELIVERMTDSPERLALGDRGPNHDVCPPDCCRYSPGRPPIHVHRAG